METTTVVAASRAPGMDWTAILAGAVLAAGIGLVLNAFGAALGLGTISVGEEDANLDVWLIVSGFWAVLSMILTYMAGGYVAGRMRRRGEGISDEETDVRDGVHGLVVWALGMIVMAWMAVSLLGAAASTVGSIAGSAAEGAGTALASGVEATGEALSNPDNTAVLGSIGDRLTRPSPDAFGAPDGGIPATDLARQSATILADVARTGEISEADRSFLVAATARVTGVPPDVAEARTEEAVTAAQEVRAKAESLAATAKAKAVAAAEATRKGAILTAFLLAAASLAAAAAAVAGGVYGGSHRDQNRFFSGLAFRR